MATDVGLREQIRQAAPQLAAAIPLWLLSLVALTIVVTVTDSLGLSSAQTSSWIMSFFGVSAVLGM